MAKKEPRFHEQETQMEYQMEGPVSTTITMETERQRLGYEIKSLIEPENLRFPEQAGVYTVRSFNNRYRPARDRLDGYDIVTDIVEFDALSLVPTKDIPYDSTSGTLYSLVNPISERYFQILFILVCRLPEWFFKNLSKHLQRVFCFEKRVRARSVGGMQPDEYAFYDLQITNVDIADTTISGLAKDTRLGTVTPFFFQGVRINEKLYVFTNLNGIVAGIQNSQTCNPISDAMNLTKKKESIQLDTFDTAFSDVINTRSESKMRQFQREFYTGATDGTEADYVMNLSFIIVIPRLLEATEDEQVLDCHLSVEEAAVVYTFFAYALNPDMNMPDAADQSIAIGTIESGDSEHQPF